MNYELSNILFVFPYFIEISKNKILIDVVVIGSHVCKTITPPQR